MERKRATGEQLTTARGQTVLYVSNCWNNKVVRPVAGWSLAVAQIASRDLFGNPSEILRPVAHLRHEGHSSGSSIAALEPSIFALMAMLHDIDTFVSALSCGITAWASLAKKVKAGQCTLKHRCTEAPKNDCSIAVRCAQVAVAHTRQFRIRAHCATSPPTCRLTQRTIRLTLAPPPAQRRGL
jgi:hypothetical protein